MSGRSLRDGLSQAEPKVSALRASIPNAELAQIASEFREGILDGAPSDWMCAAVCWPLAGFLRALHRIDCETVTMDAGECDHVWIKLADGRALDPTLDQFNKWFPWKNYPPVFVGTIAEYEALWGIGSADAPLPDQELLERKTR